MGSRFVIVDVFAESKYAGNQLAVILDPAGMSTADMQRVALEMNYSETTFVMSGQPRAGGWDVRIFTPKNELPFAGHPTLGTAWVIRREILGADIPQLVLNLGVGPIPVRFDPDGLVWMRQRPPVFGQTIAAAEVARCLGLSTADIDTRFPIQEVSTGLPFVIAPLKSLAAVQSARLDERVFMELAGRLEAKDILILAPETLSPDNDLHVRVFAVGQGVAEDPATGSANGCLAGWLARHGYLGRERVDAKVEQGHEIGRPSLLRLKAVQEAGGEIAVDVGGRVFLTARGELV